MSAGPADDRSLRARLAARIGRRGPIPVSEYVDAALYDVDFGFYATGGRAGRTGDFITAPEVGFLFGAVLARAIDSWWYELGRPDDLAVVDLGAGPGTLARSVLAAEPDVAVSGALHWASWEPTAAQRMLHPELDLVTSPDRLPAFDSATIVVANEVLDNCPFDLVERTPAGWAEVLVDVDRDGEFRMVPGPPLDDGVLPTDIRLGSRVPLQRQARKVVDDVVTSLPAGRLVVLDYGADTIDLALRRDMGWLRTHRGHIASTDWLSDPGSCDITTDVAMDQITADHRPVAVSSQATFLRNHGIEKLVAEGKRIWQARAHLGDLEALMARSRVTEAEALLDPSGMGGFFVAEWQI